MKNILLFSVLSVSLVAVVGCGGGKAKPIPIAKPEQIPPSRMMTLSQEQLVFLDWHSPHRRGARVRGKRLTGGGVEFDISFSTNDPGNTSVNFVSSGQGGRGKIVGGDISGFRSFALKFTLLSINGKSESQMKQKLEVGSVIGPTASGLAETYPPVTLSMEDSSAIAQTPIRSANIRTIGFHISALNPQDWDPLESEIKLLIEPAPDGGTAPWFPPVADEGE